MQDSRFTSHPIESSTLSFEGPFPERDLVSENSDEVASINTSFSTQCTTKETNCRVDDRESISTVTEWKPDVEPTSRKQKYTEDMSQKKVLNEAYGEHLELQLQEEELELLKEAVRMALDNEHPVSFYIEQLNEQIGVRRHRLQELEDQWEASQKPLEAKRWNLLESLCATNPDGQLKLQKLKEIDMEMHSVLSEIRKREEDCTKFAYDLEKQPKVESRRSYIERITEFTKNGRKLDADIERILKETRELKLESNSIEERLHRTYAFVDETVSREAKNDAVGRQAYQLLTGIHECFQEIREKILATGKTRREVAELEAKLSTIASRNSDMDKLQADLNAMRMENEHLENTLRNH